MKLVHTKYKFSPNTITVYDEGRVKGTFRITSHVQPSLLRLSSPGRDGLPVLCLLLPVDRNELADVLLDKLSPILDSLGVGDSKIAKVLWDRIEGVSSDGSRFTVKVESLPFTKEAVVRDTGLLVTPSEMAQECLGRLWGEESDNLMLALSKFHPEVYAHIILSESGHVKTPDQVDEWSRYLSSVGIQHRPEPGFIYPVSEEELNRVHQAIFGHPRVIPYDERHG